MSAALQTPLVLHVCRVEGRRRKVPCAADSLVPWCAAAGARHGVGSPALNELRSAFTEWHLCVLCLLAPPVKAGEALERNLYLQPLAAIPAAAGGNRVCPGLQLKTASVLHGIWLWWGYSRCLRHLNRAKNDMRLKYMASASRRGVVGTVVF